MKTTSEAPNRPSPTVASDVRAGAECDPHGGITATVTRGGGDAYVGAHRKPHAEVTDQSRKDRSGKERDGAADAQCQAAELSAGVDWQQQQEEESGDREHAQGAELPAEVGAGSLLNGTSDGLHIRSAVIGCKDLAAEDHGHHKGDQGDNPDHCDEREIDSRQVKRSHFHGNWK
jgi:hypothetical protein